MTKARLQAVGAFTILIAVFGVGISVGISERQAAAAGGTTFTVGLNPNGQPKDVDMASFWQAWTILDQNFVQTHASNTIPTTQEKVYGAIAGLAASYNDPYTVFFPPVAAQAFNEQVSGSFGGVGMELDNDADGNLVVVTPLKDSPAERAGMLTGDIITAVNGTSTILMSSNQAVTLIRGPKGTTVKLTVVRKGETKPLIIPIVRDTINVPVVKEELRGDGVYVIALYEFTATSQDLFRAALRNFIKSGSHKLILDLRGNPGGYLSAAVDMGSYFLPVGDVIVTEDFQGKQDNIINRSSGYNVFANDPAFKMAVVTDQGSASASEILAGALQQHGVAKLVGVRTFGKGSVQQLMDLGNGAELKVTIARWLTPNGSSISDAGVQPDIKVERTPEDKKAGKDQQMDAAVNYLLYGKTQ
ncbi:MAG: ctpA [Candidatus Adlerbacteria bacterium]|nr:ctpA [Candidatus Adlerbacteria bacterium]